VKNAPVVNIVLVEPEIPQNTGNIARLCAATNSVLHLVHPLGFNVDDKHLKRAGLDYWAFVKITHHVDFNTFLKSVNSKGLFFSAKGKNPYHKAPYKDGCYLIFGKETIGLPREILEANIENTYKIPIWGKVRSINLSTCVGIAAYEAYRQIGGVF
jgi:tRNA (cytidine/uridine-2'-O-)-methyltransferase